MNDSPIEQRKELRRKVELFHAYEALKTNVNFNKLILNGFMREEVILLNRAASRALSPEEKLAKSQQAQAAPVLEAYLMRIELEGVEAREAIPDLDALIEQEAEETTQ